MTRISDTRPRTVAVVVATAAGLALAACGSDDPGGDTPTTVTATDSSVDTDADGSSASPASSESRSGSDSGPESVPAATTSEQSSASGAGTPEPPPAPSDATSAPVDASVSPAPTSSADPTSSAGSPAAPTASSSAEPSPGSTASVTPGEPTAGSTPGDGGDSAEIVAIPCDGGNYLGEITPMTVDEAAGKIDQLRQAHPDATFGHFTEPCGPEDQLVIYWGEASDTTAPLLQQRRELEAPRVVVLQLDPQRPGYLDTGLCDLRANGEPPTLKAGDDLDRTDKNWLFELTSYLGENGLIHPDHAGITEIDEMVDTGIRSYQERNGLAADGVVGADTWDALSGELCRGGTPELKPIER